MLIYIFDFNIAACLFVMYIYRLTFNKYAILVKNLELNGKVLFVTAEDNEDLYMATRNLGYAYYITFIFTLQFISFMALLFISETDMCNPSLISNLIAVL